jgi:hypothetical protein
MDDTYSFQNEMSEKSGAYYETSQPSTPGKLLDAQRYRAPTRPQAPRISLKGISFAGAADQLYSALGNLGRRKYPRPRSAVPPGARYSLGDITSSLYRWIDRSDKNPTPGIGQDAFQYFQNLPPTSFQGPGIPILYQFFLTQPTRSHVDHAIPSAGIQGPGLLVNVRAGPNLPNDLHDPNYPYNDGDLDTPMHDFQDY